MKTSIASVLAVMFASQAAFAQEPEPSPNPVEEQEVSASQDHSGKPADGSGDGSRYGACTGNGISNIPRAQKILRQ